MPLCPYTGHTGGGLTFVVPPSAAAGRTLDGIDAVIRDAIAMDRWLPAPSRVSAITDRLRVYIAEAASALEAGAGAGEETLATVREARHRLGLGPGDGYASAITFARGLGLAAKDLLSLQRGLK
ncbi:DUF6415 family natural product biosynthesis protein [Streptomyces hiroshimensis]|uniref:Uncharacterized protein n=1 Tax=Streptomyces hiroshimensis TaxID=66424 RepID=A0ABQ2YAU4_9ACTN|nr:DUF6415 family natural product biosynthesis protein [Streptomyces hiroshimensis]GGX78306.1 hypothetical protein GCM10010324_24800 [Streptomyces hiroshimensis]